MNFRALIMVAELALVALFIVMMLGVAYNAVDGHDIDNSFYSRDVPLALNTALAEDYETVVDVSVQEGHRLTLQQGHVCAFFNPNEVKREKSQAIDLRFARVIPKSSSKDCYPYAANSKYTITMSEEKLNAGVRTYRFHTKRVS